MLGKMELGLKILGKLRITLRIQVNYYSEMERMGTLVISQPETGRKTA